MSAVLRVQQAVNGTTGEQLGRSAWVWCPGCRAAHAFVLANEDGSPAPRVQWEWDGNAEAPTFSPSLLYAEINFHDDSPQRRAIGKGVCHSFVRGGRWEFLGDSGHHLAGQTVDMVPLPDWLAE